MFTNCIKSQTKDIKAKVNELEDINQKSKTKIDELKDINQKSKTKIDELEDINQKSKTKIYDLENKIKTLEDENLNLIQSMYPFHIIEKISKNIHINTWETTRCYNDITILSLSIDEYNKLIPIKTFELLNKIFGILDDLVIKHNLFRLNQGNNTTYYVSAGIFYCNDIGFIMESNNNRFNNKIILDNAKKIFDFAKDILNTITDIKVKIGIHTGSCSSGLIGLGIPKFTIFGEVIDHADKLQKNCKPGTINISLETSELLKKRRSISADSGITSIHRHDKISNSWRLLAKSALTSVNKNNSRSSSNNLYICTTINSETINKKTRMSFDRKS